MLEHAQSLLPSLAQLSPELVQISTTYLGYLFHESQGKVWRSALVALVKPGLAAGLGLPPGAALAGHHPGAGEEVLDTQPEVGGPHAPGGELAEGLHALAGLTAGPRLGHLQGELAGLEGAALSPDQAAGGLLQSAQAGVGHPVSPTPRA